MPNQGKVALVTARQRPGVDIDVDLPVLTAALVDMGLDAAAVVWDDPEADWAAFDLAVIRSTWDYTARLAEFLGWVDRCESSTLLANAATLIRWNVDKHYLGELGSLGIPVVPTTYWPPSGIRQVGDLPAEGEFVVKPTVGAGARRSARYRPDERDAARSHVRRLHADGLTAMVQPYVSGVDTAGERALVFVGGEYVHAICKGPVLAPEAGPDSPRPAHPGARTWAATVAEVALARRVLAAVPVPDKPLYARVDLVIDERGEPMVMELELVEPNLFLIANPGSVPVVARVVAAAVASIREPRPPATKDGIRTI